MLGPPVAPFSSDEVQSGPTINQRPNQAAEAGVWLRGADAVDALDAGRHPIGKHVSSTVHLLE